MRYILFGCAWWIFWLSMWLLLPSIIDIKFTSYPVYILYSFPISIFLGGIFARKICISTNVHKPRTSGISDIDSTFTKAVLFFSIFLCIFNVYLGVKTYLLLEKGLSIGYIRGMYFGIQPGGDWFSNKLIAFMYNTSYAVFSLLVAIVAFLHVAYRKKNWAIYVFLTLFLLISSSFIKGARGELYGLVLLLLMSVFVEFRRYSENKKLLLTLSFVAFLVVGLGVYMSIFRAGNFWHAFFTYHFVGFDLFSEYVQSDLHGLISPFGLQFSFLGGIDYLFSLFVRFLIFHDYINPIVLQVHKQAQDVMIASQYLHGNFYFVKYNTFYTIVSSFYKSGGIFGVILGGAAIGFYIQFVTFMNDSLHSKVVSMYLLYFICMGIFSSPLEVPAFFLGLIFINLIYSLALYKHSNTNLDRASR